MSCTRRAPHQLQILSVRPSGNQKFSRSAYRQSKESGRFDDGVCACVGRYKNQPRIDAESSPSYHQESREHSEFARRRGIFDGRVVTLLELPILLSISIRLQNHGIRLDRQCSTGVLCKGDGAL